MVRPQYHLSSEMAAISTQCSTVVSLEDTVSGKARVSPVMGAGR